jgi:hypothetical protein
MSVRIRGKKKHLFWTVSKATSKITFMVTFIILYVACWFHFNFSGVPSLNLISMAAKKLVFYVMPSSSSSLRGYCRGAHIVVLPVICPHCDGEASRQ